MQSRLAPVAALAAALAIAAGSPNARANAPAPWGMCRGAHAGDPCHSRYYPRGRCVPEPDERCPDGAPCLYCQSGADTSFTHDVTPAAAALAGLLALIGFVLIARKKHAQ